MGKPRPKVFITALASDFGCQLQITNVEEHLLDILSQFDLAYWPLATSGSMPDEFDVAVIEGAVCREEHVAALKDIRSRARVVIALGSCAVTGGIPGLAHATVDRDLVAAIYGTTPREAADALAPCAIEDIIDVEYRVPGCPIEPAEFVSVLQRALHGYMPRKLPARALCGSCKLHENPCFIDRGHLCLGLVTAAGCGARCLAEKRPCNGCRGLAEGTNIASARTIIEAAGIDCGAFDRALELFNAADERKEADR